MARKSIYFNKQIVKLGPSYWNCNERQTSCTRKNADPRKGCPNCEFTIKRKAFISELDKELSGIGTRAETRKWPTKLMLSTLDEVANLALGTKGVERRWSVLTAILVGIYRDEKAKRDTIDRLNAAESVPAKESEE